MYNTLLLDMGGIMKRVYDKTGMVFGRLTVIACVGKNRHGQRVWECECICGNTTTVVAGGLASGNTTSCGCYLKERITKHGGWGKGSFNTWKAMVRRCTNPKDKDYRRYGGVGIRVCPEWLDYATFAKDMGEPVGDETLDRADTYGDYTPENCRWASPTVQARNIRIRKTNNTGHTGISSVCGGKYMAKITVKKKSYYSKVFPLLEDAVLARKDLELKYWSA